MLIIGKIPKTVSPFWMWQIWDKSILSKNIDYSITQWNHYSIFCEWYHSPSQMFILIQRLQPSLSNYMFLDTVTKFKSELFHHSTLNSLSQFSYLKIIDNHILSFSIVVHRISPSFRNHICFQIVSQLKSALVHHPTPNSRSHLG